MKYYIIKYLRYLLRPFPRFIIGFFVAIFSMLIAVEVLHVDRLGPEFSFGIPCGIGLKIMLDSVTKF